MKIVIHMLKRDRTIDTFTVSPEKEYFNYHGGLYDLDPAAVNVSTEDGVICTHPEAYYVEGQPTPIHPTSKTTSSSFLDEVVLRNAVASLSGQPSRMFNLIEDYLRNPKKLVLGAFALIILIAFLQGLIWP